MLKSSIAPASRACSRTATSAQGQLITSIGPRRSRSLRALSHLRTRETEQSLRKPIVAAASSVRPAVCIFGLFGDGDDVDEDETATVAKVQVGVFGNIRKWQQDLDRLADLHDTDEEGGLHAIFRETVTLLLRNLEYCAYATSAGRAFDNFADAERKFNSVSLEERSKFKEETLVNVDGRRRESSVQVKGAGDGLDNWMCITLVIAVEGNLKLQKMNSPYDLKQVLLTLGGIGVDDLMAFELLWTPQERGDYYTRDEMLADFPAMATLS